MWQFYFERTTSCVCGDNTLVAQISGYSNVTNQETYIGGYKTCAVLTSFFSIRVAYVFEEPVNRLFILSSNSVAKAQPSIELISEGSIVFFIKAMHFLLAVIHFLLAIDHDNSKGA
jgi:hypothetical protein